MSISIRPVADHAEDIAPPLAPPSGPARIRRGRALAPGLAAAALAVAASYAVHRATGTLPMLTVALMLGVLAANLGLLPAATRPGLRFSATRFMRAGVVLLGLQVSFGDILALGARTIVMVIAVLVVTFTGTQWLGRRLGLSDRLSLLVAAGFSICGASAVAAVDGALGTRPGDPDAERETATAVGLVTLCGSLAIVVMPPVARLLGLSAYDAGRWIGASVHDVGQVVATATIAGSAALVPAVAVKLVRVVMLAPIATGVALRTRRGSLAAEHRRPPLLPLFVLGFLGTMALRSAVSVPPGALAAANTARDVLFAAALFGLGSAVRLRELLRTGHRALVLGLTSWALIAGISYGGVLLTSR
ncbi:YeiH family protein [Actinoallomurus rhizosphaericola]|uniref:YeiH family protein n=1 Tax=Actinoallomurus rhizosphaericola TaxID=2952536 RepID=UPI0020916FFB|nr:putative sulfate exporter family transporter [Actinoallomurus rhizosphaericola]MCO5993527.1 putative sulfate exporter family transporter [Actinoallomurus rhizosphaericola]